MHMLEMVGMERSSLMTMRRRQLMLVGWRQERRIREAGAGSEYRQKKTTRKTEAKVNSFGYWMWCSQHSGTSEFIC